MPKFNVFVAIAIEAEDAETAERGVSAVLENNVSSGVFEAFTSEDVVAFD